VQVLIAGHGSNIQPGTMKAAVDEVAPLVNDTDLLIAALSLTFCTTLLQRQPQQSALVTDRVLPPAMALSKSPLLQVHITAHDHCALWLGAPLQLHGWSNQKMPKQFRRPKEVA